jgi:hypothetical protein
MPKLQRLGQLGRGAPARLDRLHVAVGLRGRCALLPAFQRLGPGTFGKVGQQIGADEKPAAADLEAGYVTVTRQRLDLLRRALEQLGALVGVYCVGHDLRSSCVNAFAGVMRRGLFPNWCWAASGIPQVRAL